MVSVGDRVEVEGRKVGQDARRGQVTAVRGALVEDRWDSGEVPAFVAAAGSLKVVQPAERAYEH